MSKSIKLSNNMFIDSKGVDYKHTNLETTIDGIKENINKITDYVSNERIIGKWIDGKPIYRVIVQTTTKTALNTWNEVYRIQNLANILNIRARVDMGGWFFFNTMRATTTHSFVIYSDGRVSEFHDNTVHGNKPLLLILDYTKNND